MMSEREVDPRQRTMQKASCNTVNIETCSTDFGRGTFASAGEAQQQLSTADTSRLQ
jgi:hypothetical protein